MVEFHGKKIEWKPMTEEKKLKFACTKLKGHAMIWWDHVQQDRAREGKDKIRIQEKYGEKVVQKIYSLGLRPDPFCRFQILKKNMSAMEKLTNEFYELSIHVDHQETNEQLAVGYVNCLKYTIQDEMSMHMVHNVE